MFQMTRSINLSQTHITCHDTSLLIIRYHRLNIDHTQAITLGILLSILIVSFISITHFTSKNETFPIYNHHFIKNVCHNKILPVQLQTLSRRSRTEYSCFAFLAMSSDKSIQLLTMENQIAWGYWVHRRTTHRSMLSDLANCTQMPRAIGPRTIVNLNDVELATWGHTGLIHQCSTGGRWTPDQLMYTAHTCMLQNCEVMGE